MDNQISPLPNSQQQQLFVPSRNHGAFTTRPNQLEYMTNLQGAMYYSSTTRSYSQITPKVQLNHPQTNLPQSQIFPHQQRSPDPNNNLAVPTTNPQIFHSNKNLMIEPQVMPPLPHAMHNSQQDRHQNLPQKIGIPAIAQVKRSIGPAPQTSSFSISLDDSRTEMNPVNQKNRATVNENANVSTNTNAKTKDDDEREDLCVFCFGLCSICTCCCQRKPIKERCHELGMLVDQCCRCEGGNCNPCPKENQGVRERRTSTGVFWQCLGGLFCATLG